MNEEKNNNIAEEEKNKEGEAQEKTEEAESKEKKNGDKKALRRKKHRLSGAETRGSYDFGRLLVGFLVVFVGSLLLAKSAGILPEAFSVEIFRLWPIFIVAFGLSLLDARSRLGSAVGFVTLLLVVLMFAIFLRDSVRKAGTEVRVRNTPEGITEDSTAPQHHIYSDWNEAK